VGLWPACSYFDFCYGVWAPRDMSCKKFIYLLDFKINGTDPKALSVWFFDRCVNKRYKRFLKPGAFNMFIVLIMLFIRYYIRRLVCWHRQNFVDISEVHACENSNIEIRNKLETRNSNIQNKSPFWERCYRFGHLWF